MGAVEGHSHPSSPVLQVRTLNPGHLAIHSHVTPPPGPRQTEPGSVAFLESPVMAWCSASGHSPRNRPGLWWAAVCTVSLSSVHEDGQGGEVLPFSWKPVVFHEGSSELYAR